jgi:hypothetical protein
MDHRRFDALTERLATTDSRRASLAVLLGLPLVGALTALPGYDVAAEKPHERLRRHKSQRRRKQRNRRQQNNGNTNNGGNSGGGLGGQQTCAGQSACVTPNAPSAYCTSDGICYCAVTRAGVPVCVSGAIQVRGGCQTDADCVNAVAGSYCIGASNQLQSPCIFGESFCASPCRS